MQRGFLGGLLGAAAALAFVPAAQAADLPVKAKPVEYVKVCSAYGAGFYYIPGTDICLRVGGYVFVEFGVKGRSGLVANVDSKADNYLNWRTVGTVILDARQNTAYGTLRTYLALDAIYANPVGGPWPSLAGGTNNFSVVLAERAFIQFAGFTFGYTGSFFNFGGAYSIAQSMSVTNAWMPLLAYTAQLGNGVSATVSLEDAQVRRMGIATAAFGGIPSAAVNYGGQNMPDIVGNFRVDQSWGSAQIMGALHEVRPNPATSAAAGDSKWGYAVGAGVEVKTPQTGNPNNSVLLQGTWTRGALAYTGISQHPFLNAAGFAITRGALGGPGFGPQVDYFDAWAGGGTMFLTEAWSAYAAYRHYWTPALRTGFSVGITDGDPGGNSATAAGGDPDFRIWQGTVSNIWSPVTGLDLSLDIVYTNLKTGSCTGAGAAAQASCNRSAGIWTAWSRIRRNF